MAPLQSVFCARTTQPKVTPTNHHLLIDIHHRRFSLGHQGLPRLHQSLEKPPASTKQEGYGEGGGVGGGEEVQGAPRSEERSLSNCCLMSCPQWTSCCKKKFGSGRVAGTRQTLPLGQAGKRGQCLLVSKNHSANKQIELQSQKILQRVIIKQPGSVFDKNNQT